MISEVILPKLGQTMEEGAIVEWLKQEGDPISRGDALFTVESDKAVLEVEATARGFLRKILVPPGETVPVLTVVALITRQADEDISAYEAGNAKAPEKAAPAGGGITEPEGKEGRLIPTRTDRVFASPRARKTAKEVGIELALVTGTGPNGRIVEQDILDFVASQPVAAVPKTTPMALKTAEAAGVELAAISGTGVSGRIMKADVERARLAAEPSGAALERPMFDSIPMTGLRRIIATRMAESDTQTARVTLVTEADATRLVQVRTELKESVSEEWGFEPGYNDLLGIIVARALHEFPYMNARLSDDGSAIERMNYVNLGMAVDTERGLLVPVIRNADRMGLQAFGSEFRTLVDRARVGRSLPDDLAGGTFTITSLGVYDVDAFTPIINLPEAAILGVGRIQPKPVVREEQVVVRRMWTLSLVFDHRLVDGAPAARFLQRIKHLIEKPYLLLG